MSNFGHESEDPSDGAYQRRRLHVIWYAMAVVVVVVVVAVVQVLR